MDRMDLTKALLAAGVGDSAVSFSEANDKYCVLALDTRWVVSFTERGIETYRMKFESEDAACRHLLEVLSNASA